MLICYIQSASLVITVLRIRMFITTFEECFYLRKQNDDSVTMKDLKATATFNIKPIGFIVSKLKDLKECPLQETEGGTEAYIKFETHYIDGIKDIKVGDKLIILTWLHLADRETLRCYKRNDVGSKEFGVFSTRSPDRPNPIGFHVVTVQEIGKEGIRIFPMEVLNATPVIDIKPLN
jgi:tRNA-Thr(GGU) m(6)t(6)A37 methyltransferase TsaA